MLTGVHFLLTYTCNLECDHCFVYSDTSQKGTFTLKQIKDVIDELVKIGTIEWVYFEGGEPFMFYPLMLEGLRTATEFGFKTGVVTNAYWATSDDVVELWLKPLNELGINDISISDDQFHYTDEKENPAKRVHRVAEKLGIQINTICINPAAGEQGRGELKGTPVIEGGALLKGRAVEKLIEELPTRSHKEFTECPEEDLRNPKRVHVDSYGYVHLCQGLVIGNMWEKPLSELVKNYNPDTHPICGPILEGGPKLLAEKYEVEHEDEYVTACHFCYVVRKKLIECLPEYLAPEQIYGL